MNHTFISVIVIGYNIEKFIDRCMQSVLHLEYSQYEIIFVDDGSTDGTLAKVKQYENCVKIITKQNGGIISARKEGLKNAKGEYVVFVDGDDWVNKELLSNLAKDVNVNGRKMDIVCSHMYRQRRDRSFFIQKNGIKSGFCEGGTYYEYIMNDKNNHHMFPKLYRKEFLLAAGYMEYPNITTAEDLLTNAFLGACRPLTYFNNSVNYYYCYNTESVIRRGDRRLLKQIETLELMETYLKERCSDIVVRDLMDYQWFLYYYAYIMSFETKVSSKVKVEIATKVKKHIRNYRKNPYNQEIVGKLLTHQKWILHGYYVFPYAMVVLEPLIRWIAGLKKFLWELPQKYDEKKYNSRMKLYYHMKTNEIIPSCSQKNAFLIGTSDRSNLGDHLIAYSAKQLLEECLNEYTVHEITGDHFRTERTQIKKVIKPNDLIFVSGGGFLGDLWMDEEQMVRDILTDYPCNPVVILPQTIFFTDNNYESEYTTTKEIYNKHSNLTLFARDRQSYHLLKEMFPNKQVELFPDMALLIKEQCVSDKENCALICFRTDKESVISQESIMEYEEYLQKTGLEVKKTSTLNEGAHNGDIILEKRGKLLHNKLEEFSKAKIVITDRLHAMIFCALVGTPCIALDNVSRKISGIYNDWLKNLTYIQVVQWGEELNENLIHEMLNRQDLKFDNIYFEQYRIKMKDVLTELFCSK